MALLLVSNGSACMHSLDTPIILTVTKTATKLVRKKKTATKPATTQQLAFITSTEEYVLQYEISIFLESKIKRVNLFLNAI